MGKPPALSADLIAKKGGAVPATDMPTRAEPAPQAQASAPRPAGETLEPLNFKVPANFRRAFKTYAAEHDLKLNELLQLSFEAYRKHKGS